MSMPEKSLTEAVANIVDQLKEFTSEDRHRIVSASMTLLGEAPTQIVSNNETPNDADDQYAGLPAKARNWMKQHGLSIEQINLVFHFGEDGPEITAPIPGASRKEQVRNAYVLCGICRLLASGDTKFDDKVARRVCESGGFFDSTNHTKYMKCSEFTATREKGSWVLTTRGTNLGASLVTQLSET
jgi:hypothetical protein